MTDDFLNEPKIAAWKKRLTENGCTIHEIKPLTVYFHPDGRLLFALLKAEVTDPDGRKIPPVIFIRGHACIIVPLIKNSSSGEQKFLMVEQRRIATGAITLEFPAGMLDRTIDNPADIALKELYEETGLSIAPEALVPLVDKLLYSSPGACDEGIYFYGCIIELDTDAFHSFEGRIMGQISENEHIRVTLKTKREAENELTSLQARLAVFLFDRYCRSRGIPV
jgi:ADP-sugar diphosphatase